MKNISRNIARWFKIDSEQGVTAIEYGLIAALVALVIITAISLVGTNLTALFNGIAGQISSATPAGGG